MDAGIVLIFDTLTAFSAPCPGHHGVAELTSPGNGELETCARMLEAERRGGPQLFEVVAIWCQWP